MLISHSKLLTYRALSLHLGAPVGQVSQIIVDPNTLKIVAFRLEGPAVNRDGVGDLLPVQSIREFSQMGMIIDSVDELASDDEIVELQNILKLNFSLIGLKVITRKKSKLGRVRDFMVEPEGWQIQQLVVQRPTIKSLIDPELVIARSEIVEVDDYKVIVKDEERKIKEKAQTDFVPNFVNPFRESGLATEADLEKPASNSQA